ncbi:2-hydroxyacyl-CoA dehydratase [Dissulfurirhabdus thermomarina]|uniref:2-hydroxyacyl-CoA dehydratase n=1 Tax=Dissulfurirhabdus thermomarina TaxID=1765737 RepID=A0A6N9TPX9_DISTH|nr:double-cubane-cluster-containing anaerobic reductase [Dissulfurirhabdus thermomarina]NDY42153.1 2-hydroxyacyl-CoA dehydratase [Dissulfurirhabdus thermomarina]NMX23087.1 2-hydroxyacyl-CoA dehydratase [Dissulfurirhabdus thermomarina]
MGGDYDEMWRGLGLDLPAHERLLELLGGYYREVYLSQADRPRAMAYLDAVMADIHGGRVRELQAARAEGRKVVGTFCVFVPEELVLAAGAACVGLCAGAEVGFAEAERLLPRNTCPLVKSFFGFRLARLCPFMAACDLLVGETTCDGKKKAYELLADLAPTYVMEVPQAKRSADRALFREEVRRLAEALEALTGRRITAEGLARAVRLVNRRRRALQRLARLRGADPAPISGRDALLVNQVAFYDDPERFTGAVEALCDELEARVAAGRGVAPAGTPRLLVAGAPMAVPNWKVPHVVEGAGAVIVGEESCIGERHTRDLVDEAAADLDALLDALVDRYLRIDCACFTPNDDRLDHVVEMVRRTRADGVVHFALQFCQPYAIEAARVRDRLDREGIPMLRIETDYSMEDVDALATRIEAFVETLG